MFFICALLIFNIELSYMKIDAHHSFEDEDNNWMDNTIEDDENIWMEEDGILSTHDNSITNKNKNDNYDMKDYSLESDSSADYISGEIENFETKQIFKRKGMGFDYSMGGVSNSCDRLPKKPQFNLSRSGEMLEPINQPYQVIDYLSKYALGIICSGSNTEKCQREQSCGCNCYNFKGTYPDTKKKEDAIRVKQSSDAKHGSGCVDQDSRTTCASNFGELAPWMRFDLRSVKTIIRVTIFTPWKGGDRIKNLQVRVMAEKPKGLSSKALYKGGVILGNFLGPATDNQAIKFELKRPLRGRYIIVQMQNDQTRRDKLELLEVTID